MALPLIQLPSEIIREVRARKWLALAAFAIVSFGVLAAGFLWPYKYESEVVIYVDDDNIIRPLMEGSAVTTKISERASAAQELLWSRGVMESVARDTDTFGPEAATLPAEKLEARVNWLRANLEVHPRGDSYFSIGFLSESPAQAYRVSQRLGQAFIEESTRRKQAESRSAYEFIDNQVKSYEDLLAESEKRLKNFLSENVDGTEGEANSKMSDLRSKLELAQLDKQETETRVASLQSQLANVNQNIRQEKTVDAYQQRINSMQDQLDNLRLKYKDSYPDIVALQEQISVLKRQRDRARANGSTSDASMATSSTVNPLYQDLSSDLANARTQMEMINTRISSLKKLLAEQVSRMERIQDNKAEYSQLTRDMDVNKQIYNDLLKRRERARVSMHLDIKGQGLNYRINETARYPLKPEGAQFNQFAMAGLLLGLLAPFGAIAGLLQIDPRVRAKSQLEDEVGIPVLIDIPRVRTPFEMRRERRVTYAVIICAVLVIAAYVGIAVASVMGVI
ncbi:lipopolysaccharide biosynthesis protein [Marinobacter halodurans]|uniref:Lipopolysaccharide biosynthesis protein n=1 Tax=Marinobacter halodurans TaxID=2528979 RepID=A0ABY1ZGT9_9GAMM|nr:XrtA system polysaccharide chain length determinant [Marinobacter halodurans]TBW51572.1 lipopolysaccharide biosynthesis protein [Marinobacter halodurans]